MPKTNKKDPVFYYSESKDKHIDIDTMSDVHIKRVKLGYKNEPYYNNEMDYGSMPSYSVDGLSAPELKIYNEI